MLYPPARLLPSAAIPMGAKPLVVLKFGGSVLRDDADLSAAVHEAYHHLRRGERVLCVVSALSGTTDDLTHRARRLAPYPGGATAEATAALLATGEAASAALLTLAFDRSGVPAGLLDPAAVGPVAEGPTLSATPIDLDVKAIEEAFRSVDVLVLPGFVGRSRRGSPLLLGRGGSDLTALFVGQRLGARTIRLVKDVQGLYDRDPARPGPEPQRYVRISWDEALELGGVILQPKALRFARDARIPFEVGGPGSAAITRVDACTPIQVALDPPPAPLRVALAGLGTVGRGVYRELAARPDHFEVVGVLVRDRFRERDERGLEPLLTDRPEELLGGGVSGGDVDVLVELVNGVQPAATLMGRALAAGIDVVTANKAALASRGAELEAAARRSSARLLASASVGGAVPALETARRLGRRGLLGFEGVLNGGTNYVLDLLSEGVGLEEAVGRAVETGCAEAEAALDLDGTDSANELELLARAAFGSHVPLRWLTREGVQGADGGLVSAARAEGRRLRLVASAWRTDAGVVASLRLRALPTDAPLASVMGTENALRFDLADGGQTWVRGRGAGRWPATVAVMADLFHLARTRRPRRRSRAAQRAERVVAGGGPKVPLRGTRRGRRSRPARGPGSSNPPGPAGTAPRSGFPPPTPSGSPRSALP